jgi:hypothetical protein
MTDQPTGESYPRPPRVRTFGTEVDAARLRESTNRLVSFLTSPEFLEQTRWVFEAPEQERLSAASQRLSVDALRGLGLDLPEGFRMSSRYFEADWPAAIELGNYPDGRINPILQRNAEDPGALDRLRIENPEEFWRIATEGRPQETLQLGTPLVEGGGPGRLAWGFCGGALSVCAGYST